MTVAVSLPTLQLSRDEQEAVTALRLKLQRVALHNRERANIYSGKRSAEDLGISAPRGLPELVSARLGWGAKTIDEIENRLQFLGWVGADGLGLGEIYKDNHLAVESGGVHLDALIYGCGFVTVGRGDTAAGEPEVLVTVESTESATAEWDYRLRRARAGLSLTRDEYGVVQWETLYLPNETILFEQVRGELKVADRDHHNIGRVPMARLLNKDRASDRNGRSEITTPIIYLIDAATRTLVDLEINREFYTKPKWTALNTDPEVFGMGEDKSEAENRRAGWRATAGMMNVIPPQLDENGDPAEPKLHEFRSSPQTPAIDQMKMYSQLMSSETGIPAPYWGFVTDNPSSADSIRQQEYPLILRAERKQMSFGVGHLEVAYLALLYRDGGVDPAAFREVGVKWRDAATPTRAAAADEAQKLISAGVLDSHSQVTWDRIGLSSQEQQRRGEELRRANGGGLFQSLLAQGGTSSVDEANALKVKAEAMATMIQAGARPEDAARLAGIEGLVFGALDVNDGK